MKTDLTLRAKRAIMQGHEILIEGAILDDLPEQISIEDIVALYTPHELLDEIGEAAASQYFGLEDE